MKRYFFDIREGDNVAIDEEGKNSRMSRLLKRKRRALLRTWLGTRSVANHFVT
jgi:hypothetical protein